MKIVANNQDKQNHEFMKIMANTQGTELNEVK